MIAAATNIPKFPVVKNSLHAELRRRVNEYFTENKIDQTGNGNLFFKAIFMVIVFAIIYIDLIFFKHNIFISLIECLLLGGVIAAIGFNVMHDGSHGSFSKKKWLNKIAAHSISMLGADHFMWNMKHNILHHTYTNVVGVDDDIEVGVFMRMAPTQKRLEAHKFQHIYFWFLYMFLYVFWIFFTDYKKYFTKKIGDVPLKKMSAKDHIMFWIVKVYHFAVFVVIPIYYMGVLPWLVGFIIATFFAGFVLSIVFQLAHTIEHTNFPVANIEDNRFEDEFATHQIKTTANFATNNKLVNWLVGGLNFQIEHHLFPKISHVHYPAISNIIRTVCAEYQLQYIEYPTTRKAIAAHVRFLKHMGNND
jgi:linoleoyl-CoA desaturase